MVCGCGCGGGVCEEGEVIGEMAEDILDGFMCSHCGVCFIEEHGFPVLCRSCYDEETPDERAGLPMATKEEL